MQQLSLISTTTSFGHQLLVIKGEHISEEILNKGGYESYVLHFLNFFLNKIKPKTSLDIGANLGNHSVVIGDHSQCLWAFEPNPSLEAILRQNLHKNQLINAHVSNCALGNNAAKSNLYINENGNLGQSSLNQDWSTENTRTIKVNTIVGDTFIKEQGLQSVDFIKLDVESFEYEVISGLKACIQENQPAILMEWNSQRVKKKFAEQNLLENLFIGYQGYALTPLKQKALYPTHVKGQAQRILMKFKYGPDQWCLSEFAQARDYSAILLLPERMKPYIRGLVNIKINEAVSVQLAAITHQTKNPKPKTQSKA